LRASRRQESASNQEVAIGEGTSTNLVDWRVGLPELQGQRVTLREVDAADATSLTSELNAPELKRFMWAPPPSVVAFERFVDWAHSERASGKYICYGVVPRGEEHACGVFELRQMQPGFLRGELGFVLSPRVWGRGIFIEAARLMLDFAVDVVKVHRIEARASVDNGRGNAALLKLGAKREGTLREAFVRDDRFVDQYLWAILASEWRKARTTRDALGRL
jgi:RimJ/RimL family protein N-acetyltransferase